MSGIIETLNSLDNSIFLTINGLHAEWADGPMKFLTGRLPWVPFYLILAWFAIYKKGWKQGIIIILLTGLAVGLADWICATAIRPFVERLRPSNLENPISSLTHIVNGYRSGRYGFPSCHAANTFALATFFSLAMKRRWLTAVMFCWALLLCYSRVYLGVHYPGDLLVGATIGALIALALYKWLYPAILRKLKLPTS